jgi:hypothetical protein
MANKRGQNEESKKNLAKGKKFSKDYQPPAENKSRGKQEAIAEKKEIEKSAEILKRILSEQIENKKTGEVLTKKEAMLLGVLTKAIKEHDLKAVELVLKLIGELDNKITLDSNGLNIFVADDKHKQMLEDL